MSAALPELYRHDRFEARRKFFKVFGAAFHLWAPDGSLMGYSKQKAFRLREDIRVYADEEQTEELLLIRADRVIDWGAVYSVLDGRTGEPYGSLRRKGFSSLFRDSWEILDPSGVVRGRVTEESAWKAFLRRFVDLSLLMPQAYLILVGDQVVGAMRQNFNVFVPRFQVDLSPDRDGLLPRPLAIAAVILLLAVEGRQQ